MKNKTEINTRTIKPFDYVKSLRNNETKIQNVNMVTVRDRKEFGIKGTDNYSIETKSKIFFLDNAEKTIYGDNERTELINKIENPVLSFVMKQSFKNNICRNKELLL